MKKSWNRRIQVRSENICEKTKSIEWLKIFHFLVWKSRQIASGQVAKLWILRIFQLDTNVTIIVHLNEFYSDIRLKVVKSKRKSWLTWRGFLFLWLTFSSAYRGWSFLNKSGSCTSYDGIDDIAPNPEKYRDLISFDAT